MLTAQARAHSDHVWTNDILPALHDYIAIPALSRAFDADWERTGHLERAVQLIHDWCAARPIPGLAIDVQRLPGRTPLIVIEVPATAGAHGDDTVVIYGHLDKQPEMVGWRVGLAPWTPVLEGDRLYGRGGADDGYSAFASLAAIEAVHAAGGEHCRCVVLIEASEESGSPDLPAHVEALATRIGTPSLVLCLDSGCADYDRLWVTSSLRGLCGGTLTVRMLTEGVHSGDASGAVASTFRIARQLLSRIEDETSGAIRIAECYADIPADRRTEAADVAAVLADGLTVPFPFVPGGRPTSADPTEHLLVRTWMPTLSITGADGLPSTTKAGNVLRPFTSLQLSIRLPPTVDAHRALEAITAALTASPPYGADVTFNGAEAASGWNAPTFEPWLWDSLQRASVAQFGAPALVYGEGGTIPFMGMLGAKFPAAQFVVTGVLGPGANAHGPNEYLHIPTARKLTATLADVLDDHARRAR